VSIGGGPGEVFRVERGLFLGSTLTVGRGLIGRGFTFGDLPGLLFLNWGLHLLKGLILDLLLRELLFLSLELESDDSLDLP